MNIRTGIRAVVIAAMCMLGGCRPAAQVALSTQAKDVAKRYYEALVRKDWPEAYGLLAAESKAAVSADRFARLAQDYHRSLGFEPKNVVVTACDEHGAEAVAHVSITGASAHHQRFKDATVLKQSAGEWFVVLSPTFGQARR